MASWHWLCISKYWWEERSEVQPGVWGGTDNVKGTAVVLDNSPSVNQVNPVHW